MNGDRNLAVFCDFENIALGARDAKHASFDVQLVLQKLLLKGSIVVKKAYCDWERYKEFKAITISGHSTQSLNVSFGLRQRISLPTCASAPSQPACADAAAGSIEVIKTSANHHIVTTAPSDAPPCRQVRWPRGNVAQ